MARLVLHRGAIYQFPSVGFTIVSVVNSPDEKLVNPISMHCTVVEITDKSRIAAEDSSKINEQTTLISFHAS